MATVRVRLRNAGNTATTAELDGAFDVSFQIQRNDVGVGSFKLPNRDSERPLVSRGSVVRFALAGEGRFIARVIDDRIVDVSVGDEDVEATEFICAGILSDWGEAVVRRSTVPQCDLVPSLDERIWNWASGESNPLLYHGDWPRATAFAGQGWGSAFYTGEPAGWTDSAAFFVWAEGGRLPFPDDDLSTNALPGRCLFKDIFLVGAGKKMLEWACDNAGNLWVNGKQVQSGTDFRKKQVYEFETTAGFLTLAWDVTNAEDDGPAGGNPGGLIASLRNDGPEGDIIWRTSAEGPQPNNAYDTDPLNPSDMRCLEYPAYDLPHAVGAIVRLAGEQNPLVNDNWTLTFGDLYDTTAVVEWDTIEDISFRLYDDSLLDMLKVLAEVWADWRVLPGDGFVLSGYKKNTIGAPVGVTLTTGYSTAGQADPDIVNVLDLSWDVKRARFTALAVRWADGWIELGDGDRWGVLRIEQINDLAVATAIGERMLELYGQDQYTAAFTYLPLDEDTDLPLDAFDVHDLWDIPGPLNPDGVTEQVIQSITVKGDENGEAEFVIEVGPQVLDEIAWLERAIDRVGPGSLLGLAAGSSPTSGKAPYHSHTKVKATSPSVGAPVHCVASAPGIGEAVDTGTITLPHASIAPNMFVGMVTNLRLVGQGGTGTSTVEVTDGVTTWTLSGSGEGTIDFEDITNRTWSTSTILTVTFTAVGHRDLHVYADVAEVN